MVQELGSTLETKLKEIEVIAESLEKEGIGLAEAIKLYEKGVTLIKECEKSLNEIKQRIEYIRMESLDESTSTTERQV